MVLYCVLYCISYKLYCIIIIIIIIYNWWGEEIDITKCRNDDG